VPVKPWSPRLWGAHALLVVALAATVLLGYWQWHVSRDHRASQVASFAHEQPKPLTDVMSHNDPFPGSELGRPVEISGTWVPGSTVYVHHDGGYWVASPIAVGAAGPSTPAIYVVRGWSPTPTSTDASGAVTVVGWLEPGEDGDTIDTHPHDDILPAMQLSLALAHTDRDLFSAYAVVADHQATWTVTTQNDGTTGLRAVAEPAAPKADPTTGLRNLLYAFQWWVFGCFAIYIWWRHVRDVTHPAPDDEPASSDAQTDVVPSDA
jgi:surfeit locus 1 family protein